jgi:hypothetical protein
VVVFSRRENMSHIMSVITDATLYTSRRVKMNPHHWCRSSRQSRSVLNFRVGWCAWLTCTHTQRLLFVGMRTYSAKIKCRTKKAAKQQGRPQCTLRNVQKRAKPRAPTLKLPYLALAKHVHWQRVDAGEGSSLDLSAELLQFADYIKVLLGFPYHAF